MQERGWMDTRARTTVAHAAKVEEEGVAPEFSGREWDSATNRRKSLDFVRLLANLTSREG